MFRSLPLLAHRHASNQRVHGDDSLIHSEHSDNLVDWFSGLGQTELVDRIDDTDGTSQLTFRSLTPLSAATPRKFLRVRFELGNP